ncbi:MAG: YicC family protein [Cytophagales bacterium]|nr:MAG: YicC family protein [Cytophagales bacterium]
MEKDLLLKYICYLIYILIFEFLALNLIFFYQKKYLLLRKNYFIAKIMIVSMTGFGRSLYDDEQISIIAEVKTLNSKYFDAMLKTSRYLTPEHELEIRNLIQETLERGKINFHIEYHLKKVNPTLQLNTELITNYYQQLKTLAEQLEASTQDLFRWVLQLPDVNNQAAAQGDGLSEEDWAKVISLSKEALQKCTTFRKEEGKKLEKVFEQAIQKIKTLLQEVEKQEPNRQQHIRQRLLNRLQEINNDENYDKNRFEQEMIYYIEKLDIAEEKQRLASHLNYFLNTLSLPENSGKKLHFVAQEIGREINTLGAKANDALIQQFVVQMKEELEKIKEQLANII